MTDTLLRAIRRSKSGTSIKPKRAQTGITDLEQFKGLELFLQAMQDLFGFSDRQFGIAEMLGFVPGQIGKEFGFGDEEHTTLQGRQLNENIRSRKALERFNQAQISLGRDELNLGRQSLQADLASNPRDFMKLAFFRAGLPVPPALASAGGTPAPSSVNAPTGTALEQRGIVPLPGQLTPLGSRKGRTILGHLKIGGAISSGHTVSTVGEGSKSEVALLAPGSVVAPLTKKQRDRVDSGDFNMREAVGAIMKQLNKTEIPNSERGSFLDSLSAASDIAVGGASHGETIKPKLYKGSGPEIYLIENGVKRLIPNRHTFTSQFDPADVVQVDDNVLAGIPDGEPLEDTGELIQGSGPEVFLLKNGIIQHIPNQETFTSLGFTSANIRKVSDQELSQFQVGQVLDDRSALNPDLWTDFQGNSYIKDPNNPGFTGSDGPPPNGLVLTNSLTSERQVFWYGLPMGSEVSIPDGLAPGAFLTIQDDGQGGQTFYWVDFDSETLWDADGNLLIDHGFELDSGTVTPPTTPPSIQDQMDIPFIKSLIEKSTDATTFPGIGVTEANPEGIENPISPFSGNVAFALNKANPTDLGLTEGFESQFGIPFDDFIHEATTTARGIRPTPTGARSVFKPIFRR